MTKKIVIACPSLKFARSWAKAIKDKDPDFEVEIYPNDTRREETEFILCFLPEEDIFSHYPHLKVVGSLGAGVRFILTNTSLPKGITVTKIVQKKHQQDMAEFVLGLILSHTRRLMQYTQYKAEKKWSVLPYQRAEETSVGIMGIGAIGQVIGSLLVQCGFTVTGWSRSKKHLKNIQLFYGKDQKNDFLKTADILVCVLPLTDETTGILNKDTFAAMRKGAYLINVGRGAELVEEDLLKALENGQLSGAALDVFRKEPLPADHPFWEHEKIMITPHTAGDTHPETAVEDVLHNYEAMKKGRPLKNTIDRKRGY